MGQKRVLIVDDDINILRMLEFGLKKFGPEYKILTSGEITEAIQRIEKEYFDLVITDYMMPTMTGIDLARAVRKISPETQVILMTAYGTNKLRNTSESLPVDGFLNKPFTMDQFRQVVLQVSSQSNGLHLAQPELGQLALSEGLDPIEENGHQVYESLSVIQSLQKLQVNAGARAVLLLNRAGRALQVVGEINRARLDQIGDLVTTNHYGPAGLSQLLDNKNTFRASFYEGDTYNLYVCDVDSAYLLAVVFDVKLRPGVVWFYTKQAAAALSLLIG
ncbi:MAG TPA: response regulator [Anaerolineae bacterium]|nr:response regulator [Anaerolineae bacterium]HMR66921.1 response regulator [Anaerolineae bacterium]